MLNSSTKAKYKNLLPSFNISTFSFYEMARGAYATYIFHPVVVVICLLLTQWHIEPAIKLLLAAPLAVIVSFCLGCLIAKVPFVKNVV